MARVEFSQSWARVVRGFDPLLPVWRLLTSVRFALGLIGFVAFAGLLSVLIPQIPAAMRDSPAAVRVWVELQKDNFGPLTEAMHRLGLFSVYEAPWFLATLGLLALSICVYAADRFLATWRNVVSPPERVPDSFFERAANRVSFTLPVAREAVVPRLEAVLRRRRFQVRRFQEGGATYLFADRFAWAQLGTFVSHLALVVLLAGGLISSVGGFTTALFIAEGTASPVFAVSHPNQMQVEVVDAVGEFDQEGTPLDYRTELVIYQGGEEVARGVATVNSPLSYGGYRFHQAGYFAEGAALRVRDVESGNSVYREVLALDDLIPAPVVTIRDAQGTVLLDDVIVPTDFIGAASGTLLTVPGTGRDFWVGSDRSEDGTWNLVVYDPDSESARFVASEGQPRLADGLEFTLVEVTGLPAALAPGLPGDNEASLVVLSETPDGTPYLTVMGAVDGRALTLYPDQPVQIHDREYEFGGRREFAGIEVRRDPGAMFIWVAAALLLAGLLVSFYVPRLRLWVRVRDQETVLAGPAERGGAFQAEAERLAKELGVASEATREEDMNV